MFFKIQPFIQNSFWTLAAITVNWDYFDFDGNFDILRGKFNINEIWKFGTHKWAVCKRCLLCCMFLLKGMLSAISNVL